MPRLVHLHHHSTYSFLDAWGTPEQIVVRAEELGHESVAITDHGNVIAHVPLWLATKGKKVRPIYGCEAYITDNHKSEDKKVESLGVVGLPHITLLAKTATGYRNLLELQRISWMEGCFGGKPRIDRDLLSHHCQGLIVLSGCAFGYPTRFLWDDKEKRSVPEGRWSLCACWLDEMKAALRDSEGFYVEVTPQPGFDRCEWTMGGLVMIARSLGIPVVATADGHFTTPDRHPIQDLMLRRSLAVKADEKSKLTLPAYQYLCTAEELKIRAQWVRHNADKSLPSFEDWEIDEWIERSAVIADGIAAAPEPIEFKELTPARFWKLGYDESAGEMLWKAVGEGFARRRKDGQIPDDLKWDYHERLEREWKTLTAKGFADYILTVADIVNHVKSLNGLVMLRGSAGGCLLLWLLGASETDPIKHDLSFERFYDENRPDAPDVDADFEQGYREMAVEYVREKYGADRVAQIAALSALKAKAALADVAWVLDIPRSEFAPLSDALDSDDADVEKQFDLLKSDIAQKVLAAYPKLGEMTPQLAGQMRQASVHACGVLITQEPIAKMVGVMRSKDGHEVAQLDKRSVKKLGGLKMDLLAVQAYDVVGGAIRRIAGEDKEAQAELFKKFYRMDLDDEQVLALADHQKLAGVFQLEGPAATRIAKEVGVKCFEDLVAVSALCRPGPADWAPTYLEMRDNRAEFNVYLSNYCEKAQAIIRKTNGILLYQEQVMALSRELAAFEWKDVHELRKGVVDKLGLDPNTGEAWRLEWGTRFLLGCSSQGVTSEEANHWWKAMQSHGGYSFNRSHCVTYGKVGYWTLYLKAKHPHEFYLTALKLEADPDKQKRLLHEYRGLGNAVRPLHRNSAADEFSIADTGGQLEMLGSLASLKGVGPVAAAVIRAKMRALAPFNTDEAFLACLPKGLAGKIVYTNVLSDDRSTWKHQSLILLIPWWPPVDLEPQHLQRIIDDGQRDYPKIRLNFAAWDKLRAINNSNFTLYGYVTKLDITGKHKRLTLEDGGDMPVSVFLKKAIAASWISRWHEQRVKVGDFIRVSGWMPNDGALSARNDLEVLDRAIPDKEVEDDSTGGSGQLISSGGKLQRVAKPSGHSPRSILEVPSFVGGRGIRGDSSRGEQVPSDGDSGARSYRDVAEDEVRALQGLVRKSG